MATECKICKSNLLKFIPINFDLLLADGQYEGEADVRDEKFRSICEKTKELSGLISVDDYRDVSADTYTDPILDTQHTQDNVEMSEDCDVAMDTEALSGLQNSDGEDEMEVIMGKLCFNLTIF